MPTEPCGCETKNGWTDMCKEHERKASQQFEETAMRIDPHEVILAYPFPIREGFTAELRLPRDLTKEEAARITKFLESLVKEEPVDSAR